VLVPFARLLAEADRFAAFAGELGVRIEPGERVEGLRPWLGRLALVAVSFPAFTDGRGYSTAYILRHRFGYRGELRAVGNVLVDQRPFLRQCGFDAFEVAEGRAWESWRKAAPPVSVAYQPGYASARGPEAIWQARRLRRALAAE
jgi:phosphoadenosine phosphosulfate reductase